MQGGAGDLLPGGGCRVRAPLGCRSRRRLGSVPAAAAAPVEERTGRAVPIRGVRHCPSALFTLWHSLKTLGSAVDNRAVQRKINSFCFVFFFVVLCWVTAQTRLAQNSENLCLLGPLMSNIQVFHCGWTDSPWFSPRRPQLGGDTRKMDPELLKLPLAVKIPVAPGTKPVFSRGKLGQNLVRPCPYFNLDDPYSHHLSPAYNCLHDPILQDYHKRKDILQLLKRQGVITRDNKVVCTLKEFNEYRNYLTRLKLQSEQFLKQQEGGLLPLQAKLKDGPKLPGPTDTSCRRKRRLQPQTPSSISPPKSRKLGECRTGRVPLDKGQSYSRAELGQEDASTAAGSREKPDGTASDLLNALCEQLIAAEVTMLEELVEIVVHRVLERLEILENQHASFSQGPGQEIRGGLLGSCIREEHSDASLNHRQKMEALAKELAATVLEILGDHLASSTSKAAKTGVAARWEELPLAGRTTQAGKSKDTETATADRALAQTSLDTLTREVVENVHCTSESFVTSEFEQNTSCDYTEILELPGGNVSSRQLQLPQTLPRQGMEAGQGLPRASEQQNLKARLPTPAERAGYAKIMEPEDCAMVKEPLERKMNLESAALANTLDVRTMTDQIADSEQINQPVPAPAPEESFQGAVAAPATSQGRMENCAAEDAPPSVDP